MKSYKKVLFSLVIAAAAGAFAPATLAEMDGGRITYSPADAIDLVAGKTKVALDALLAGQTPDDVSKLIKDALDASKEVNANDKVDMARSRANNKLKAARKYLKEGSVQQAEQELQDAYKGFLELKTLL